MLGTGTSPITAVIVLELILAVYSLTLVLNAKRRKENPKGRTIADKPRASCLYIFGNVCYDK